MDTYFLLFYVIVILIIKLKYFKLGYSEFCFESYINILILLMIILTNYPLCFSYNKELIKKGEIWRFFTGHMTHMNTSHLLLNIFGLLIIWELYNNYLNLQTFISLLITCMIIISCFGLYYLNDSKYYNGMSGVLTGVLTYCILMDIDNKNKLGYILLFLFGIKIIMECQCGSIFKKILSIEVVTQSHLVGILSGILYFLFEKYKKPKISNRK